MPMAEGTVLALGGHTPERRGQLVAKIGIEPQGITIVRFGARTFSRSQGQKRKSDVVQAKSALLPTAGHWPGDRAVPISYAHRMLWNIPSASEEV